MVKRSDVLVSIDHLWVGGDFDESELLVRPSALVPLSRSENPLSAHPTPRGSSQRNQMHPHATRMLADYWRAFTPDDVHPWLDDMYAGVHVTPWAFAALAYALQKRELWEDEWGREEVVNPGVLLGISADIEAGPYDADALTFARTLVQDLFPGLLEEEDLWDEEGRFDAEAFWDWQDDYYDGFASDYVSEGEYMGLGSIAGDVANRPQLAAFIEELEAGNAGEGWTREMLEEEPEMSALKIAAEVVPQGRILGEVPASQIVAVVVVENYPPGQDGDFAEEFEAAGKEFPYWADEAEVDLENFSNKVLEEGTTVWGDPDKAEFWHGTSLDNAKAALPEILTPDVIERAEVAGRLWPDPPDPYDEEDDE